jgi:hypothetical protein
MFSYISENIDVIVGPITDVGYKLDFVSGNVVPHTSYLIYFNNGQHYASFSSSTPIQLNIFGNTPYGSLEYNLHQSPELNSSGMYDFTVDYYFKVIHPLNNCTPAYVVSTNSTEFFAGDSIMLEPGFYTEDNAVFEASIFGGYECENNTGGRYATEPIASSNSELPLSAVFSKQKKTENEISKDELEKKNEISLFPNPASNSITISSTDELKNILIFNLFGEQIYTNNKLGKNIVVIETDQFSNGVYVFSIETENKTKRERVIIQK